MIEWWNQNILWGLPMLALMMGCGIYLTARTGGFLYFHWREMAKHTALSLKMRRKGTEGVSPLQAVSTALAATVGTGNIVGVSVAVAQGGAGAIFWMWIAAFIGMMTKFSEVTLAVAYRHKNHRGEFYGGPMYYISEGVGSRFLSTCFCVFGVLSSFGIGNMVQANAMAQGLAEGFGAPPLGTGLVAAGLAGLVLVGGIRRISRAAEFLVPFMALFYMLGAAAVLLQHWQAIPAAFGQILQEAFTGRAAVGGAAGFGVSHAIRIGVARGTFTNEAGLGSAPIAHASAQTEHPVMQGFWGAFEVFFDTLVMCTVTALVVLTAGEGLQGGGTTVQRIFAEHIPGGGAMIPISLTLFAFSSILAWYYYGEQCMKWLAGEEILKWYRRIYLCFIVLGCTMGLSSVWQLADLWNGLMALPNLLALFLLAPRVAELTEEYQK